MKEKKLSNKKLVDASLVGERTIQRLRNDEEYPTTVLQNNAYRCVLSSCAENSLYEVNEMLEFCGFEPLGNSKMG